MTPDVPDLPQALVDGFCAIPPATIAHIGHIGQSGFVDRAVWPVYRLREIVAGRAVTQKLTPGDISGLSAAEIAARVAARDGAGGR